MEMPPAPPPLDWTDRPAFAGFIAKRDLTYVAVGAVIGVGPQQVRHYCRRWDDPKRQIPRQDVLERIVGWTQSEITAGDFYPPHLREGPQDAETLAGGVA
ncbi:hypothetical protein [uncultured Brevundimonas sp.]|uniref:hypothetical protein n=1 Tax=uncultured Brevundimonas sp. TaxID=213418 RepID=UPI0025E9379A|nr:hypothetical protein [uncultured Brevundimonas sp.]